MYIMMLYLLSAEAAVKEESFFSSALLRCLDDGTARLSNQHCHSPLALPSNCLSTDTHNVNGNRL